MAATPASDTARRAGAVWGIVGVVALVLDALGRVWPFTRDALRDGLSAWQWLVLVVWVLVMVFSEGYRGFQQRFAPRMAARSRDLRRDGGGIDLVLAPLYCLGLFHATRRELAAGWGLVLGIVALVLVVRTFDQPWRGIVDAGVLVGLAYGLVTIVVCTVRTTREGI